MRDVINQFDGLWRSQRLHTAPQHWRVQETAFSGIWRVLQVADDGAMVVDRLETGDIPAPLTETMLATATADLPPPDYPVGCMNARPWSRKSACRRRPGSPATRPTSST